MPNECGGPPCFEIARIDVEFGNDRPSIEPGFRERRANGWELLLPTICRIVDRNGELVATVANLDEIHAFLSDNTPRKPLQGKPPLLSVVIPLFNEELNVEQLHRRLVDSLDTLGEPYEILFVNDGSRDDTPGRLERIQDESPQVTVIHLSRNFGHQAAVSAGLEYARGRAVVVMDGDLQDPPEVLPQFVDRWRKGYDVVYAVRLQRKEGPIKRLCYFLFYRIMNAISDIDIPLDSGDFCLMDRKVIEVLVGLPNGCVSSAGCVRSSGSSKRASSTNVRHVRPASRNIPCVR